jgi:hypothetical protein
MGFQQMETKRSDWSQKNRSEEEEVSRDVLEGWEQVQFDSIQVMHDSRKR